MLLTVWTRLFFPMTTLLKSKTAFHILRRSMLHSLKRFETFHNFTLSFLEEAHDHALERILYSRAHKTRSTSFASLLHTSFFVTKKSNYLIDNVFRRSERLHARKTDYSSDARYCNNCWPLMSSCTILPRFCWESNMVSRQDYVDPEVNSNTYEMIDIDLILTREI